MVAQHGIGRYGGCQRRQAISKILQPSFRAFSKAFAKEEIPGNKANIWALRLDQLNDLLKPLGIHPAAHMNVADLCCAEAGKGAGKSRQLQPDSFNFE